MRAQVFSALPLLSPSQINKWRECQRLWAFVYIAGIRTPQSPAAALGTEVDDTQFQPYLRDGREFDYTRTSGYIAAAGLAYLPKPKSPGLEVQKHFVLPAPASGGRWAYQGYMDLYLPDSAAVPDMPGGAPFVGDFKTTSDLKWAKSAEALKVDVQAMTYAMDALYETGKESVDLSWMYFQTRGPRKTKRTYVRVGAEHVLEQFKQIEATATELFAAKTAQVDPLSLPPTPSHCEAYGGCPFRHKCNLGPSDTIVSLAAKEGIHMSDGTSSLMANLAAKKARAQGAVTPTTSSTTPGESAPSPSPPSILEEALAANKALGINPPEKDLPPAPPVGTPKRGPGRPKKDPLAADFAAATGEPTPRTTAVEQLKLSFEGFDYSRFADAVVDAIFKRMIAADLVAGRK